ncbi:MAG: LCP family protein [Acidobacteria bacterium]|nr:LCP family protein [Acidobacteriota bacterium]
MAADAVRSRRSWPQRLLIAFNLVVIVGCLTGAGGLGYLYYQFGRLPRIDLDPGHLTARDPGDPQNFLLVGSDSRAFVEAGSSDEASFGDAGQTGDARADTIILVRVDPRTRKAAMLSFPRDLWVPIAGTTHSQRINTAFAGGPQRLIDTIKQDFNVSIQHYAQVDFKGFKELVDAVGGVTVYLASPVRDHVTGLHVEATGCVELKGDQALAYVRSRHFQYKENGRWRSDPTGDLGRINRQQDFIRRAIREALAKGLLNPARLNRLVAVGVNNVKISKSLKIKHILELGREFHSLSPDTIQQYQLPVSNTRHGAASTLDVLSRDQAKADKILDVFRGVTPESDKAVAVTDITVRVMNGSGVTGEAAETTAALRQLQFGTADPGTTYRHSTTIVQYGDGQEAKARLLQRYLKAGAELQSVPNLSSVDVQLVTGEDYAGILQRPLPATSTTTTAPAATSTSGKAVPAPQC